MKIVKLLALFAFLYIAGCGVNDDAEPDNEIQNGSFKATITGDQNRTFEGEAVFVHAILKSKSELENGSVLGITLTNKNNEDEFMVITVGEIGDLDGINPGTYTVDLESEEDGSLVNIAAYLNGSMFTFLGVSGQVTLTKIEGNKVEGSFSATFDNLNDVSVTMSGDFSAEGITQTL